MTKTSLWRHFKHYQLGQITGGENNTRVDGVLWTDVINKISTRHNKIP